MAIWEPPWSFDIMMTLQPNGGVMSKGCSTMPTYIVFYFQGICCCCCCCCSHLLLFAFVSNGWILGVLLACLFLQGGPVLAPWQPLEAAVWHLRWNQPFLQRMGSQSIDSNGGDSLGSWWEGSKKRIWTTIQYNISWYVDAHWHIVCLESVPIHFEIAESDVKDAAMFVMAACVVEVSHPKSTTYIDAV